MDYRIVFGINILFGKRENGYCPFSQTVDKVLKSRALFFRKKRKKYRKVWEAEKKVSKREAKYDIMKIIKGTEKCLLRKKIKQVKYRLSV